MLKENQVNENKIINIGLADKEFMPYQFGKENTEGIIELCCCMKCLKYKECKIRLKLRDILLGALERIYNETDIKRISSINLYNIFEPHCEERASLKENQKCK